MASSLIDAYEPAERAFGAVPVTAPLASLDASSVTGPADTTEVDQAVRNWAWETPGSGGRPSARQDLEELWLAR
jgi:hypothetical protein